MVRTTVLATVFLLSGLLHAGGLCPCDCYGDGLVKGDELLRLVRVALETRAFRTCPPGDVDGDGLVRVNELVRGVSSLLNECPATVAIHRAPAGIEPAGPLEEGRGVLPNGR